MKSTVNLLGLIMVGLDAVGFFGDDGRRPIAHRVSRVGSQLLCQVPTRRANSIWERSTSDPVEVLCGAWRINWVNR